MSSIEQILLLDLSFIHTPGFSAVLATNLDVNNCKTLRLEKFQAVYDFLCLVLTSSTKHEIRQFHVADVQRRQKKSTKKCDVRAKLLFCQFKAIVFLLFSLTSPSSLLKLPFVDLRRLRRNCRVRRAIQTTI